MVYCERTIYIENGQVKEELNQDLIHHLLQVTPLNLLQRNGKSLKNYLEESYAETDLGFGNYAGEIFERFDEKSLVSVKDIKTLLYYLSLVRTDESLAYEQIFLYDQQVIFERKVTPYIERHKDELFLYYIFLKANGMFKSLDLPLPTAKDDFIQLLDKMSYSNVLQEVDYFKNHITNVFLDWNENGFTLNENICKSSFVNYAVRFLTNIDDKKLNKNLLKYFKALAGNPTEKRLEYIINYHIDKQTEKEIVLILSEGLNGNWRNEGYDEPRKVIRIFLDILIKHFYLCQSEEEMKQIINLIHDNSRMSEIYNEEYVGRLQRDYKNVSENEYVKGKMIFNAINTRKLTTIDAYNIITLDNTFSNTIVEKILNNKSLEFNDFSLDMKDAIDCYVVMKLVYNSVQNDKIEDMEKLIPFLKTLDISSSDTNFTYSYNMFISLLFKLRNHEDVRNIIKKYLVLQKVRKESSIGFTEEYLIKYNFKEKTYGQLIVDIANNENLSIPKVVSDLNAIIRDYYRTIEFNDKESNNDIDLALFIFKVSYQYLDETGYHKKFLTRLIALDEFKERFTMLNDKEKNEIITFLDSYSIKRNHLYATPEELKKEFTNTIYEKIGKYYYYKIDFLDIYNKLKDENEKTLFVDIVINEYVNKIFNEDNKNTINVIKFIKKLIEEGKFDNDKFWDLV